MAYDLDKTSERMGDNPAVEPTVAETEKKKKTKKTKIAKAEYAKLQSERDNLAAEINELKSANAQLLEANKRLAYELSAAPSIEDLLAAQTSASKLQASLLLTEKELVAQKLLMEEKSLEIEQPQSKLSTSSKELVKIESVLSTLREENLQFKASLEHKEQDLEGLREGFELLRTEAQSLREQLTVRELPESGVLTENEGLKRDLAQLKSQSEEAAKEAQRQLEEATRVTALLKSQLETQVQQNTLLNTANAEHQLQLSTQQTRVESLEREVESLKSRLLEFETENATLKLQAIKYVCQLEASNLELTRLSKAAPSIDIYPMALQAELNKKQAKVEHAMQNLLSRKTSDGDATPNDLAIDEIIGYLQHGLRSDNAQTYFDENKEGLKEAVYKLRGSLSILNTAVNAILTVLAVCSVVGITALWLTGTLQKNMDKNGSVFAFTMFGAKQLAECDIYQVTQEMGVKLGG